MKRRAEDMMSGIVSGGKMKLSLEHTFTGQILHNVDSDHIRSAFDFDEGIPTLTVINNRSIHSLSGAMGRSN